MDDCFYKGKIATQLIATSMKKLDFDINIKAPPAIVWEVLWNDETYRKWTKPFSEESHAISNWNLGDEILFVDGTRSGMYSMISQKIENKQMTFKHLGIIKNGIKQPIDDETKKWSGAIEAYYLTPESGGTNLNVALDSDQEFESFFKNTFPKALNIIKELSEQKND